MGNRFKLTVPQRNYVNAKQLQKRCPSLLVIRDIQPKAMIRYDNTFTRMVRMTKHNKRQSVGKNVEKLETSLYIPVGM